MSHNFKLQTFCLVLVSFLLGCNEFIIVGILPELSSAFHTSQAVMGLLVTAFALIYAICTPFVTINAARFEPKSALNLTVDFYFSQYIYGFGA